MASVPPNGNNFARTMAKLTRDKSVLRVVHHQRGRPTSAEHLAKTALALLDAGARDILHVTDGGECTWYEFTRAIAEVLGRTCAIEPCTTAEFPRPAQHPAYSVLDLSTAANQNIPGSSACKCNTREIAEDSTSAMVA